MTEYTLVLVDTTGIQSYIFGSNRLRENVGASQLVYLATEGWLRSKPDHLLGATQHNLHQGVIQTELRIEDGLEAELFYAGGGNTVLLFRHDEKAKQFITNLSRKLIEEAPGLEIVAIRQPVSWAGSLAKALNNGMKELKRRKLARERSAPLLGLGVTASCQSTGLVANWEETEPGDSQRKLLISSEVRAKWDNNILAKDRLRHELRFSMPKDYDFPSDFDDLGRSKGDFSYLAVVHADGNGMGKLLEQITERYIIQDGAEANRAYIEEVRQFSVAVNKAGQAALSAVVDKVADWNQRGWLASGLTYDPELKQRVAALSIRPIVFGGDDVTFVCDGRIGLATAQIFLDEFGKQQIPTVEGGTQAGVAAAGVAIVKVHYPFARAYALSETLCKNAKNTFARKVSALDWHLAQGGLSGSLGEIRRREYDERRNKEDGTIAHSLQMRPLALTNTTGRDWHTWENFVQLLQEFRDPERWPRNRVMRLRDALRQGSHAVAMFASTYGPLPDLRLGDSQYRNRGWLDECCVYFDAIEMIEQEVWS